MLLPCSRWLLPLTLLGASCSSESPASQAHGAAANDASGPQTIAGDDGPRDQPDPDPTAEPGDSDDTPASPTDVPPGSMMPPVGAGGAPIAQEPAMLGKPNIILILADDMGYSDLGSYGATIIQTPSLDALAENGMRFTQFYNNAKCGPTRVSMMTGISMHRVGRDGASGLLKENTVTIAEVLKTAGYNTLLSGKWHLAGGNAQHPAHYPKERGFDRAYGLLTGASSFFELLATNEGTYTAKFLDEDQVLLNYPDEPNFYVTDAYNKKAVEYLEEYAPKAEPFFMYLAHQAPHLPLHAPEVEIQTYQGKFMIGWDELRAQRFAKQKQLGIVSADTVLPARENQAWQTVTNKAEWDRRFATHAAMVRRDATEVLSLSGGIAPVARCAVLSGGSPVPVGVGAPGSRSQVSGETPVPERDVKSLEVA